VATTLLPLLPGTLPEGICYASEQERLNGYAEVTQAVLSGGLAFYNYGDTEPGVDYQGYPWLNTNTGLWYTYVGQWRSPRPKCEQDLDYRILWAGLEANIPLKDGGTAGVATLDTGPFWEIDTLAAGRSPMAPGLIAGSDPTKTLARIEQYGAGSIALTTTEMPAHTHSMQFATDDAGGGYPQVGSGDSNDISYNTVSAGSGTAFSLVHPVYGLWVLKPTIRVWYTL
jgi:hypothetical protein